MLREQKIIYRGDLRANPDTLYVFGDNASRIGYGGQAGEMRDEPNAVGLVTCWAPGVPLRVIDLPILKHINHQAVSRLMKARDVVWPTDGIGTGLAGAPQSIIDYYNITVKGLLREALQQRKAP